MRATPIHNVDDVAIDDWTSARGVPVVSDRYVPEHREYERRGIIFVASGIDRVKKARERDFE
jgi:hypothetical protein